MALEQKLSLKLAQKLVMTPSLQQAIKLLQMTRIELEGVLTQELVENPVLEDAEIKEEDAEADTAEADTAEEDPDRLSDIDIEAFFGENETWESAGKTTLFEPREAPPIENTLTSQPDLYDHLLWQLRMMDLDPLLREIAELIIGNLNPEGFLVATVEEIRAMGAPPDVSDDGADAETKADEEDEGTQTFVGYEPMEASAPGVEPDQGGAQAGEAQGGDTPAEDTPAEDTDLVAGPSAAEIEAGYPRETVEEALEVVRDLDPPGVAYPDLRESLLAQLRHEGYEDDELPYRAINETWELFKHRKFEAVAKKLGVPLAELEPVVEKIRELDTRPGRPFDASETRYVEPDVHVVKVDDEYVIQLNDDGLPRLRVSRAYRKLLNALRQKGKQDEAQQYIKDKMRSAVWLIKSLDQRQRTIYKVAESIVKQQRPFLDYGIDHMRPMVLRDVAEDIEMHESTVSRVVSNKYIHTPRGLFPLKFFFHSGIDREYGGDISSLSVKSKIRQLVQDEDPQKPLSDSALMRALKREGIQIARRTVAKYRDELNIPSSTERKKIF